MKNLLDRLKILPWRSLIQVAILTVLTVVVMDFILMMSYQQSAVIATLIETLFRPPLGILVMFAVALGVGALAVYYLEQLDKASITTSSLWALVLCLAIAFFLRGLLPPPALLIQLDQLQFIGLLVGVFWKSRPYWQSYRHW